MLKEVSRSFYLSLRLLPAPMRPAACLAYLLARTSDTIADAVAPAEPRLDALDAFAAAVAAGRANAIPAAVAGRVTHSGERRLLGAAPDLVRRLAEFPEGEAGLVRGVVATIIGGQRFDITRFGTSGVTALADEAELDDYTFRVAGCVGAFWTDLGFLTLGPRFSREDPGVLRERGVSFGKGLQLVNILRDLPADFARGRCYLPADPADRRVLMETRDRFLAIAAARMDEGVAYARAMRPARLRVSVALPAMIGRETLGRMRGATWETLSGGVKIRRGQVYRLLARAVAGRFG